MKKKCVGIILSLIYYQAKAGIGQYLCESTGLGNEWHEWELAGRTAICGAPVEMKLTKNGWPYAISNAASKIVHSPVE